MVRCQLMKRSQQEPVEQVLQAKFFPLIRREIIKEEDVKDEEKTEVEDEAMGATKEEVKVVGKEKVNKTKKVVIGAT